MRKLLRVLLHLLDETAYCSISGLKTMLLELLASKPTAFNVGKPTTADVVAVLPKLVTEPQESQKR